MRKLLAPATDFPDSFVWLLPMRFQELHYRDHEFPVELGHFDSGTITLPYRGQYVAIDIELKLIRSSVANPHRPRIFISRQPRNLIFNKPAFATHAIDRLHLGGTAGDGAQKPFPHDFASSRNPARSNTSRISAA